MHIDLYALLNFSIINRLKRLSNTNHRNKRQKKSADIFLRHVIQITELIYVCYIYVFLVLQRHHARFAKRTISEWGVRSDQICNIYIYSFQSKNLHRAAARSLIQYVRLIQHADPRDASWLRTWDRDVAVRTNKWADGSLHGWIYTFDPLPAKWIRFAYRNYFCNQHIITC